MLPEPMPLALAWICVNTQPMLLSLAPPALIDTIVGPFVVAIAHLGILEILALVNDSIGVAVDPDAVHVIVLPFAVVLTPILPGVLTKSIDAVVEPLAVVDLAIRPDVLAAALLLPVLEVTSIDGAVLRPVFLALARLLVVFPVAFVACALGRRVYSEAVAFVCGPLALVPIAIDVVEGALPGCVALLPLALVISSIEPTHGATAIPETATHVA